MHTWTEIRHRGPNGTSCVAFAFLTAPLLRPDRSIPIHEELVLRVAVVFGFSTILHDKTHCRCKDPEIFNAVPPTTVAQCTICNRISALTARVRRRWQKWGVAMAPRMGRAHIKEKSAPTLPSSSGYEGRFPPRPGYGVDNSSNCCQQRKQCLTRFHLAQSAIRTPASKIFRPPEK